MAPTQCIWQFTFICSAIFLFFSLCGFKNKIFIKRNNENEHQFFTFIALSNDISLLESVHKKRFFSEFFMSIKRFSNCLHFEIHQKSVKKEIQSIDVILWSFFSSAIESEVLKAVQIFILPTLYLCPENVHF